MITTVNPGRFLQLEGSFELGASLADVERDIDGRPFSLMVHEHESNASVPTLADLLRSFLEDPTETVTGPIRITIEPAR